MNESITVILVRVWRKNVYCVAETRKILSRFPAFAGSKAYREGTLYAGLKGQKKKKN